MNLILEEETRVWRTYKGGMLIDKFLGKNLCSDSDYPEDWISSFTEAKNKVYVQNEGITRAHNGAKSELITNLVDKLDFGIGRDSAGVLIKLLDSAERLGIQVHPTSEFSKKHFNTPYGKTECWHILDTRQIGNTSPCVYIGFKEGITREVWRELFEKQDIAGMLNAMHRLEVKKGDTILVKGGVPHAIGGGCFLLEIQEPTDYTMRAEKVTVAGERLTPMQIHYGVGEENMLDCFSYTPQSRSEIEKAYVLKPKIEQGADYTIEHLVTYDDTPCFKLSRVTSKRFILNEECCITIVVLSEGGIIKRGDEVYSVKRGDKLFAKAQGGPVEILDAEVLVCYPPDIGNY